MAKTTADVTLVRGAAAMGEASMPADLSGLDKITEKGNEMQKAFGEKIEAEKTRRKELNDKVKKDAEEVILNSGSLGKGIFDATFTKMQGLQDKYAIAVQNGNEQQRLDLLRQVQAHSVFIQDHKDTRLDYATKIDNNEQSKGIGKENLHAINKIQAQEYEYGENEKGEPVFKFQNTKGENIEMTQAEYRKLYEPRHYETTTVMAKEIAKIQKGTYIGVDAKNQLAQTIDKLDDAGARAALADDVMGQSFGQMLEADRTVSKEIAMALGDDDGIIDDDELINFIDVVTNPDNKSFNLEISKGIFKDKLFNALENKNNKRLLALQKEKDDEREEKNKGTTTKVVEQKFRKAPDRVDIPKPDGTFLTDVSTADLRRISSALDERAPSVGIAGNFGYYYPDAKGKYRRYDSQDDFIFMNTPGLKSKEDGGGLFSFNDAVRYANINGLEGGAPKSIATIKSTEKTEAGQDSYYTTSKTTTKN